MRCTKVEFTINRIFDLDDHGLASKNQDEEKHVLATKRPRMIDARLSSLTDFERIDSYSQNPRMNKG